MYIVGVTHFVSRWGVRGVPYVCLWEVSMSCWYPKVGYFYNETFDIACGFCPGCVHVDRESAERLRRREKEVKNYVETSQDVEIRI